MGTSPLKKWIAATLVLSAVFAPNGAIPATAAATGTVSATSTSPKQFTDLQGVTAARQDAIQRAVNLGLLQGDPNGRFRPQDKLTRQEVAAVLTRIFELPLAGQTRAFTDVEPNAWAGRHIEAVRKAGIMLGDGYGSFRPRDLLTREELAVLLIRASGQRLAADGTLPVEDAASVSRWAQSSVRTAMENGAMLAESGRFAPQRQVERQEIAEHLLGTFFPINRVATVQRTDGQRAWINGVAYQMSESVKGLLNAGNNAALQGAQVRFTATGRTLESIKSLELVAGGREATAGEAEFQNNVIFDGKGATVEGDLTVSGDFTTIKNVKMTGNLLISSKLEHDFYAEHIEVQGQTLILGGDPNTVVFEDSVLGGVDVQKSGVSVEMGSQTKVQTLLISSDAKVAVAGSVEQLQVNHPQALVAVSPSASVSNVSLGAGVPVTAVSGVTPAPLPVAAPILLSLIPEQLMTFGNGDLILDLSPYFTDVDPAKLKYSVASTSPSVAKATSTVGSIVTISAFKRGTATLSVGVTNPDGKRTNTTFRVIVNERPAAVPPAAQQMTVGDADYTLDLSTVFTDADGDLMTYEVTSSDPSVATAVLGGTQLSVHALMTGTTTLQLKADDGRGGVTTTSFDMNVNRPPTIGALPMQTLQEGGADATLDLTPYLQDPDGDPLTVSAVSNDSTIAGVTLNGNQLVISPVAGGLTTMTVTLSDGQGGVATSTLNVKVNRKPIINALPTQTLHEGGAVGTLDLASYLQDPDGDAMTVASVVSNDPNIANVTVNGTQLELTPVAAGQTTVTVTVSDGQGGMTTATLNANVNQPPKIGPLSVQRMPENGAAVTLDLTPYLTDLEGDSMTASAVSSDSGVAAVSVAGNQLTITPLAGGQSTVTVTVTDAQGGVSTATLIVTVNQSPAISSLPAQTVQAGGADGTLDLTSYLQDPEGDPLTVTAVSLDPSVAAVTVNGKQLVLTPGSAGQTTVTVTVSDGQGGVATKTLSVKTNQPPVIGALPTHWLQENGADGTFDLTAYLSDAEGDPLTVSAVSADPSIATVSLTGKQLTITPLAGGQTSVTVTLSDGQGGTATAALPVRVNQAPKINSLPDQTVKVGGADVTLDLNSYLQDLENDPLTVSAVSNDPSIAAVSVTGKQVTVTAVAVGQTTVTITVSDGRGGTSTKTLNVTAVNNFVPTVISALPEQVVTPGITAPRVFDLTQLFHDADGDTLTYTAVAASAQGATATISGHSLTVTPGSGAEATTVTITADDGKGGTATYDLKVRTAPLAPNGHVVLRTKQGVSGLTYDLSKFFPNETSFTVYKGTPGTTDSGPTTLNGTVWNGTVENQFVWVIGADGTAAVFEVIVEAQGAPVLFFSEYLDAGDGRIAIEMAFKGTGDPNVKAEGYVLEAHQYVKATGQKQVVPLTVHPTTYPGMTYHVIDSIFYDFFDIINAWYYNDELRMYNPSTYNTVALVLKKDGQIVDVLGDPNSTEQFMSNGGTIIRKPGIYSGSTTYTGGGEWDFYPKGTLQFYGKHTL